MSNLSIEMLLSFMGICVFLVTATTQMMKELPGLVNIRTNVVVLILSFIYVFAGTYMYIDYKGIALTGYMIPVPFIIAFLVSYISMFGWDKLWSLWNSSRKRK